jgi:CHRD domain/RTX calcium-binding nonapeptide repeat (4 copies)
MNYPFASRAIAVSAVLLFLAHPSAVYAAYTSTVTGLTATMTGDAGSDTLSISQSGGLFQHNRFGDPGFNSANDFNTTVAGDQTLAATTGIINIIAGDGNDVIVLADGINLRGTVDGGAGVDTIDYAAFTTAVSVNLGLNANGLAATLGADQEVPPTTHAGTASAVITNYNIAAGTFDIVVTVSDVPPASVNGFHIHQAPVGVNGPIIVPFNTAAIVPAGTGFTFNATGLALPAASEAAFLGGGTYVNIHTTAFPGGAIRGQIFSQGNVNLGTGRATGTASIAGIENVQGGSGNDSLVGNNVANLLNGSGGADWIVGAPGADTMSGGAGDDVLVWSNGDGTDVIEGGSESDLVQVNGSLGATGDQFVVSVNGTRVDFDRVNLVPFSLDIGTVETLTVNGIGGNDTMTVNSLTGVAPLSTLNLNGFDGDDLFGFATSSNAGIVFNVRGGAGADVLQGPNSAVTWNVTGPNQGNIAGLVTAFSFIEVLIGGTADDTFNVRAFANAALQVIGGGGSDRLNYNAELRAVSGVTAPPAGAIDSPGVATVTFSESEFVNIVNGVPTNLRAASISGNIVTLRWTATGTPTTDYLLEGGINPGQVLATARTGNPAPIFTFTAPRGAFFVRVRTVSGAQMSDPSNEIRIFVDVPVPPSAPAGLTGVVNGSAVELSWKNTFAGGEPSRILLNVTGSLSGTVPIGLGETVRFPAVPGGNYTVSLRAANASGTSGPSNAITLSVPGPCSGPPSPPENFLAYKIGNTIHVIWDPASTGPASTGYVLIVSGPFSINFPTTFRALSGMVPAGTYNLSVLATNTCGFSAPTPAQTVVVP